MAAFAAPPCGLLSWSTRAATVTARLARGSLGALCLPVARPPTTTLSAPAAETNAESPTVPSALVVVATSAADAVGVVTALHSARDLVAALSAYLSTPGAAEAVSVVKFHAPSCRSCAGVRLKYERLALAYATDAAKTRAGSNPPLEGAAGEPVLSPAVACYAMDVSRHADLCTRLGVDELPYFMVLRGGHRVFARAVAWNRFDDVRAAVDAAVHAETPAAVDEGTRAPST